MSDTAQPRSHLLNKMRGAFLQSSVPVSLQQVAQDQSKTTVSDQPVQQPVVVSTPQRLDVLDQVLTQAEQSLPAQQPAQQPQQPLQTPVQTIPPVVPQQQIQNRQQNMGMIAQATPTAVNQAVQQQQDLQAAQAGGSLTKETVPGTGVDMGAAEVGSGVQYVEQEPMPEISPEVSEYLQHAEDRANQEPQEIVIGEEQQQAPLPTNYSKQAVIMLPITPDIEKVGAKKSSHDSIRWLVEWSRKLIKMFSGTIIYRQVDQN